MRPVIRQKQTNENAASTGMTNHTEGRTEEPTSSNRAEASGAIECGNPNGIGDAGAFHGDQGSAHPLTLR